MESAMLAIVFGVFAVGLMLYQAHYKRDRVAREGTDGVVSTRGTGLGNTGICALP